MNGYFLAAALTTHTGVVANEPYRKGLAYNSRIAAQDRQTGLGWTDALSTTREGAVAVQLADRDGGAVTGLTIAGTIGRPSMAGRDRELRFLETSSGSYLANVGSLEAGAWIITIDVRAATRDAEPVYRMRRRQWLKP